MLGGPASAPSDVYVPKHPMHAKFARSLVKNLIVACGIPFAVVEKPEFVHDINPRFAIPSRPYITNTILPQLVEKKTASVNLLLSNAHSVALTLNIWTDRATMRILQLQATFLVIKIR